MEFEQVVRARRMVRSYRPDRPVSREVLTRLLDLAVRAPSAGFSQGWDFVVLSTPEQVGRFWAATTEPDREPDRWLRGMRTAPALILCLSDRDAYLDRYAEPDKGWTDRDEARWPVPYWDVDTGMASMIILLAAVDAGLAGCFFGVPPTRTGTVREAFAIPSERRIVGVISLGHPPEPGTDRRSPSLRRGRKPIEDVCHDGAFGSPFEREG
ncbi:nitroreductase family protein [Kineosporia rhizophila]|uniref:nitroreductase family protein n=1 Tax=Kineosporia rhizophila TaxID=84633 RepID=UPI001E4A25A5|nr:nitroreductase family protein [Kineosporia rhizophila]MCE0537323.1 nitroreductase family protein [Kineosporia rhizophila]